VGQLFGSPEWDLFLGTTDLQEGEGVEVHHVTVCPTDPELEMKMRPSGASGFNVPGVADIGYYLAPFDFGIYRDARRICRTMAMTALCNRINLLVMQNPNPGPTAGGIPGSSDNAIGNGIDWIPIGGAEINTIMVRVRLFGYRMHSPAPLPGGPMAGGRLTKKDLSESIYRRID
jgi:hypothetical protein